MLVCELTPSVELKDTWDSMGATLSRPLVDGVGIVFPAYKTLLCLQDGGSGAERDDWLRYWAVFGAFRVFEYICDRLVLWYVVANAACRGIALLSLSLQPRCGVQEPRLLPSEGCVADCYGQPLDGGQGQTVQARRAAVRGAAQG